MGSPSPSPSPTPTPTPATCHACGCEGNGGDTCSDKTCPRGWDMLECKCFQLVKTKMSRGEGKRYCAGQNGHLAYVKSGALNLEIFGKGYSIEAGAAGAGIWLGYKLVNGKWKWDDNSELEYDNWNAANGWPEKAKPDQICSNLQMYKCTWISRDCNLKGWPLCQKDPV